MSLFAKNLKCFLVNDINVTIICMILGIGNKKIALAAGSSQYGEPKRSSFLCSMISSYAGLSRSNHPLGRLLHNRQNIQMKLDCLMECSTKHESMKTVVGHQVLNSSINFIYVFARRINYKLFVSCL